jgi:hypothetical protein
MAIEAYFAKVQVNTIVDDNRELLNMTSTNNGDVDMFLKLDPLTTNFKDQTYADLDIYFGVTPLTRNYFVREFKTIVKLT